MAQTVVTHDDHFVCPYCNSRIHIVDKGFQLTGACEHLLRVDGGREGPRRGHFVAPDEYLVPNTDCHRTGAWVYVTPDDPRYARAYQGGHLEPGSPAPTR
ncbi:MAG: hypothetical protein ACFB50_15590 [Rubrobacteraceae bacterium]